VSTQEEPRSSSAWSVIARAQGSGPEAREALCELVRRYEGTVLMVLRRRRLPPNQTPEDLKQQFFEDVFRRGDVMKLDREKGRFRGWLHWSVNNVVKNAWAFWHAAVRGNKVTELLVVDIPHSVTPDALWDRAFAQDTLMHALERHRAATANKERFDTLMRFLPGRQMDLAERSCVAELLGLKPNALAAAIHLMRSRHADYLREAVADTLDLDVRDPAAQSEIDDEMCRLYRCLTDIPDLEKPRLDS
jgi:hypothetical protein